MMVTSDDRMIEMEQRLADLEAELRARERPKLRLGSILREVMPPDVRTHLRAAQRERLLAVRAYLDRMINRMDAGADETL